MAIFILMLPLYLLFSRTRLKPAGVALSLTLAGFFAVLLVAAFENGDSAAAGTMTNLLAGSVVLAGILIYERRRDRRLEAAKSTQEK